MSAPSPRPRAVTAAFWCWVVASVLLIVGGLITASVSLPPVFRGAGVLVAVAGAGLAFLAGRTRNGDVRFRRAALALSLAIIVVVGLVAILGVVHILTLIGLFPLIAGIVLITRPAAARFYQETQ